MTQRLDWWEAPGPSRETLLPSRSCWLLRVQGFCLLHPRGRPRDEAETASEAGLLCVDFPASAMEPGGHSPEPGRPQYCSPPALTSCLRLWVAPWMLPNYPGAGVLLQALPPAVIPTSEKSSCHQKLRIS